MPVPPGLLIDIALLIVREFRRSRKKRTAPAAIKPPARLPARRLSPAGRVLRLAIIAGVLWLIWREVARRRAALIEAQRTAFSRAAAPSAAPPGSPLPSVPAASPDTPPTPAEPAPVIDDAAPSIPPIEAADHAASQTDTSDSSPSEHTAPEGSSDSEEIRNGTLIGWCARCRARHPMQQVTFEINAGGRAIARGVCPICGAGITRFVTREQAERGNVKRGTGNVGT